ncbi:MAG: hypothetical protein HFJ47_03720 [Clostridia bacterium]|nr:hypothetical protein [Clostridia bacterium]
MNVTIQSKFILKEILEKGENMKIISFIICFGFPIATMVFVVFKRSKYKNKSMAGAFFIEDSKLVLNTLIPYPIPFDEIECVELHYNSWELEHQFSYVLIIKVIQKTGKIKRAFYKGYRTAKLALPTDMEKALHENGINCVMISS